MAPDIMSAEETIKLMSPKNLTPKTKGRATRGHKTEKPGVVHEPPPSELPKTTDVAPVDAVETNLSPADRPPLLARAEAARTRRAKDPRRSKRPIAEKKVAPVAAEIPGLLEENTRFSEELSAKSGIPELEKRPPSIPMVRDETGASSAATEGEEGADGAGNRRRPRGRRGGRGRGREKTAPTVLSKEEVIADAESKGAAEPHLRDAVETLAPVRKHDADSFLSVENPELETVETEIGEKPVPRDDRYGNRRRRGRRGRGKVRHDGDAVSDADEDPRGLAERDDRELSEEIVVEYEEGDAAVSDGLAREMMINVSAGEECRIAILQDGRLEELFIERTASQSHVGNIYKGRVTNVEPSIQAAFIDFGLPKNGFLHISDVQPQYFPHAGETEDVGRKIPRHHRPPIQKCFRRGQEVIVQITKEGVGTKGPTLTTYLSIPGRFLVMMPGMSEVGVSRKIEDETIRRKMRDMLAELELPPGMGFILRTAGMDRNKRELQRDLHYLHRLWRTVVERVRQNPAPAELYRESDLVIRTIRDVYSADFKRVVVDDAATAERVREFLLIAMPRARSLVEHYTRREPLFHHFGIESEIDRINTRHVPLKSGGSLVIDSTEAMVAIDVNSGKFRALDDAEETAFKINIEAAEEIARQLRLRDLGGLIVCDFIDMRQDRHKRAVERSLKDALRKHKERARLLRMSAFGLIEMTRQRQGPSLKRNIYFDCPHCRGTGLVKMPESVILDVIRIIQLAAHHDHVRKITVTVASDVAHRILNKKRALLTQIEVETTKTVMIRGDASFTSDQIEFVCEDERGQLVPLGSAIQHEPLRALPREPVVIAP